MAQWLTDKLKNGDIVVINGGNGTEMEQRGVPMNDTGWSCATSITAPDIVREIHEDYIRAGAEVITANPYATSRQLLATANLDDQFEHLNQVGIQLAQEARDRVAEHPVAIGGSMSTTMMFQQQPDAPVVRQNFRDQASILAEAGADIIMLEMMRDMDLTCVAIEEALATGLPVWCGMSLSLDNPALMFESDDTLDAVVKVVANYPLQSINIMHSLVAEIPNALTTVRKHWQGIMGAYAHHGEFEIPVWHVGLDMPPPLYADNAAGWIEQGIQIVGGCCGTRPAHIAELTRRFKGEG